MYKAPEPIKGREVLWGAGQNDGKMLVRKGGSRLAVITALIEPTSEMATQNSRYTIRDFGIQRLVERMIQRYAYCDLQLNVGLKSEDFDKNNSEYQFRSSIS